MDSGLTKNRRITVGGLVGTLVTALVFGLAMIASTVDGRSAGADWAFLAFESAILLWTSPALLLAFTLIGALHVHLDRGTRILSALAGLVAVSIYVAILGSLGLLEFFTLSLFGASVPIWLALLIAGLAGGAAAHGSWFPGHRLRDHVESQDT
ncbi:hypothetical protein [Erythrobacter sp. THAF29]|uniref:hypothetical protein n=1 Tax=Erythrobacter sp. THAF29 TaxID=2587851 RepID=UPI001268FE7D|nr:hypothetical protein [Erythrobacter sp. THAF29]QFT76622.1 hypothetical protein FIU90_03595 [Erythrobacter sp. THAF29]